MAVKAKQQYYADETTIKKEAREFGMIDELKDKLDSIEYGAQVNIIEEVQENGVPLEIVDKSVNVLVPEVIDNLYTIDPNNSLSAKQGKILYDMIKNLLARGRFLSTWNTATGLPVTNPEESPYPYKAGDYYIVGIVAAEGGTNFRPEPGEYVINVASDEQETSEVHVSDIYVYDGENWILLINSTREIAIDDYVDHTYQSTNPVENQAIAREIDTKQNKFYTVSTTSPSNPAEGDEWYDATNDKVFYWDGTQWKEMGGGSTYTAGLHISIDPNDNNKISVVEWSATSSALGLVKLGSDTVQTTTPNSVTSTANRTYRIQTNSSGQLMVNVPWTDNDTTYTAGDGINISNQNVISCTVKPVTVGPTAPATPGTGDLWYDTTKNTMFLYKNNSWTIIGPEIYPITKADYEALTPAEQGDGRFFLITDNDGTIYVDWDNVQNRPMYIGATAPSNPCEGYIWYDTTNDVLKVYDGTQWNEVGGGGGGCCYTAGNGIDITNDEISIDTTVVATKTDLNSKQDVFHTTSSTAPSNPSEGDEWYDTTNDVLKVYDGTNWIVTGKTYTAGDGIDITNDEISVDVTDIVGTGLSEDANNNIIVDTTVVATQTDLSGKQDKATSGSGAPSTTPTYVGQVYIDTTNDNMYVATGTSSSSDWTAVDTNTTYTAGDGIDITNSEISVDDTVMQYPDYYWSSKTGASVTLDFNSTITPSANFTVNAPATIEDGQTYILRVVNGNTAYTMSLGTNVTNPHGSDLTLEAGTVQQFVFLAVGGNLELQAEMQEKLVSGTNIKTVNNNSLLGSGNINIPSGKNDIVISEYTAPADDSVIWYDIHPSSDSSYRHFKYYDGYIWAEIERIHYDSSAPTYFEYGDLWYDTNYNVLKYYNYNTSTWESVGGIVTSVGNGIDISNGEISVNVNDLAGTGLSANGGTGALDVDLDALDGFGLSVNGGTGLLDVDIDSLIDTTNGHLDIDPNTSKVSVDMSDLSYDLAGEYLSQNYSNNKLDVDTSTLTYDLAGFGLNASYNGSTGKYLLEVDAYDIAGFGLSTDSSGANTVLKVDTSNLYSYGGGINIDSNDKLVVDTSEIISSGGGLAVNSYDDLIVDTTVIQEKLTAGDGIDIDANNEISVDASDLAGTGLSTDNNNNLIVDSTVVAMQSDLANYYTKTETYTKTEVDNLISSFGNFEVVASLPSVSTASEKTIYLLGPIGTGADKYEEWIVTEDSQQQKQWTKIGETSVDLSGYATTTALTNGLATKQDTLTAGDGIDITNNEISIDTDVIQEKLIAGTNITIEENCEWDTKGPAPSGFHVPTKDEWDTLSLILFTTLSLSSYGTTLRDYLKIPFAGYRWMGGSVSSGGTGYYWTSTASNSYNASCIMIESSSVSVSNIARSNASSIRCFKNISVTPDNSWTTLYDGSSVAAGAGIFHNTTTGLISISGDGVTWYTIQDKNLGATEVFNGGTVTDANSGYFYQWGNNYGFPHSGTVTTSSTQVDASNYGPGNYYNSSTFITRSYGDSDWDWSSISNNNLRGGVSQGQGCMSIISSTNTTYTAGDGIDIDANDEISVDVTDIIGTGLSEDANNNIIVDYDTVANALAGTGLEYNSGSSTIDVDYDTVGQALAGTGLTYNGGAEEIQIDTTVVATQTDLSGKQDKATSGSTAPSTTPSYIGQQYVDTTNDILYVATGTSSSSDWTEVGAGSGDMLYSDFGWDTLTGASVTLALRGEIEPSANFTVNKPNDLKDGQFYVLRVVSGATAYTMTLGTDVTNPYSEDLTLSANTIAHFTFLAKDGELELQPSTEIDISGKQDKATSGSTAPATTPSYIGQQYVDTTNDKLYVATGTSSSSDWMEVGAGSGDMLYADFNWVSKTGATVTLDINSTITPSANFTVNAPATIKDGQIYILRVVNGATAYTMTLGTGITNPYSTSTTLTANGVDQFVFQAIGGNLELLPDSEIDISGKQDKATTGSVAPSTAPSYVGQQYVDTTSTVPYIATGTTSTDWQALPILSKQTGALSNVKIWVGTQSAYEALATKDANTLYFTTPSS